MRLYLLLVIALFFLYSPYAIGQDSTWIKIDLADFAEANAMAEYIDAADFLAHRVAQRRKEGPMRASLVENYHKAALWYLRGGDYARALIYIDSTLSFRELTQGVTLTEKARSYNLKGDVFSRLNNHYLSEQWFDKGLAIIKRSIAQGDSSQLAFESIQLFTGNTVYTATVNRNFEKASLLLEGFSLLNDSFFKTGISSHSILMAKENEARKKAFNYQKQKLHYEAVEEYQIALEFATTPTGRPQNQLSISAIKNGLANNYNEAGKSVAAIPILREALEGLTNTDKKSIIFLKEIVTCLAFLATAHEALDQYDQVFQALNDSKPYLNSAYPSGKGSNLGYLLLRAAQASADQDKFEQAEDYFHQSINALIEDTTGTKIHQLPIILNNTFYVSPDVFVEYLAVRQNAFIQEADAGNAEALPLALETAFKLDSFLNRSRDQLALTASLNRFIEQERRHYAAGIDVALRLYRETGQASYLEDAYYFASSQKSNLLNRYLNSPNLAQTMGVPQEVIDEQQDLELRVLILEQQLNTAEEVDKAALREELLAVNRELDVQRETIAQDYPAFSQALRGYERLDLAAATEALDPNQLVVEYFLSDSSVYVFTIDQDGLEHLVLPRPDNLTELVAQANTDEDAAALLYQAIVAPAIAEKDNITRLQFIPDGDLWQASFAALRNGDRYLIQDYAISYAYASAMLFADRSGLDVGEGYLGNGISYEDIIRRINASPSRSAVGNQLRDLGPLPFARREVNEAAAVMGGVERINTEATKARFLEEGPRAGILHLAMHGIINDNPMENALVFRGEQDTFDLLTMQEVLARKFPAALTILSACHSGNGPLQQNEGVQSIGRAFMAAGSRSTITSAWEAQDEATYKILTEFYAELDAGVPLDVALQTATTAFLQSETKANRNPINWANLKLHGAVAPIGGQTNWWIWGLGLAALGVAIVIGLARTRVQRKVA